MSVSLRTLNERAGVEPCGSGELSTTVRVVVTGATGNVGTGVLAALADEPRIESIVGIARRRPAQNLAKVEWQAADVTNDDLVRLLRGADAVVHLVWIIQPSHDETALWRVNVGESIRVFEAVAAARVPVLLYESSFGAYSPGPKDQVLHESWPTHGLPSSPYSRQKAYVERVLDAFAVVPDVAGLRLQAVHAADVGEAYRRALLSDVSGSFNLAAKPVLDPPGIGAALHARTVRSPPGLFGPRSR